MTTDAPIRKKVEDLSQYGSSVTSLIDRGGHAGEVALIASNGAK
jgi:hypothetical protein